jgi:hypothetical protein
MGFMDKLRGLFGGHKQQIDQGIDKAADAVKDKVPAEHDDKVAAVADKAHDVVDNLADTTPADSVPADSAPATPVDSAPADSAPATPAAPVGSAPADSAPATPADSAPADSAPSTPSAPADPEPAP